MSTPYQRITFNGIYLGDHAWATVGYNGNVSTRIVPRAKGAIMYDTKEMGGGIITITVNAWVVKDTRRGLEKYFYDLQGNLGRAKATLDIEGALTIADAAIESYEMSNTEANKFSKFTVTITKPVE